MDFSKINILELLPQRLPFIMVDKLLYFDETKTVTELTVRPSNLFFEEGKLSTSGVIENIAQTCAAHIGYINKYILKQCVKLGYIGAIRNMEIYRTPKEKETITTEITIIEEIFQMTLVHAIVKSKDETIAIAEMKIALSKIDSHNT